MADYRESLSNTLNKSLQEREDGQESRLDRLTAFSTCERLSTLLGRLKSANDSTCWLPAIKELSKQTGEREMLCELALHEWMNDKCHSCKGQSEITLENGRRIQCSKCRGTGIQRASDRSRSHWLKCSMAAAKQAGSALTRLHGAIGAAEQGMGRQMNKKLQK